MRLIPAVLLATYILSVGEVAAEIDQRAATISAIRRSCMSRSCADFDAVVFIHGIFGGPETFRTRRFDWPARLPPQIGGRPIDVFEIDYTTSMLAWLRKDIATLDEVVYGIFNQLYPENELEEGVLAPRRYRSVGFVAHSLGGNVAAALLHTVKTELGHPARARYGYLVTLATPVTGAQIANVGLILKNSLGMRDPLLESLQNDNTFLRMLVHWRRSENTKATRFSCRPVHLYAAVEGARLYRSVRVVPEAAALNALKDLGLTGDFAWFDNRNHLTIAKPSSERDEVYDWVNRVMEREMRRLANWPLNATSPELCNQVGNFRE